MGELADQRAHGCACQTAGDDYRGKDQNGQRADSRTPCGATSTELVAAGSGRLERTVPIAFSPHAGMDISRDNGLVVDRTYEDKAPYEFTGTVRSVVFDLQPESLETLVDLHAHASG